MQCWLDVVGGNWAANAAAMSLTVLAIASLVGGLWALLGELGLILAVLTMVLMGNPVLGRWFGSRAAARTVGAIGRLMPPGAGGNLLRSTGFFDRAAAGGHAAVLVAWTLVGLAVLLAAGARHRRLATERAQIRAG